MDKDQPIVRTATMDDLVAASAAERRFALIVFEAFALAALALAAAGIYGVLAGSVAERTREIGVRSALGASRGMIVGLVVRQGLTLTACGVLIGLVGAAAASQVLVAMLFGVSPLDPATYLRCDCAAGNGGAARVQRAGVACGAGGSGDYASERVAVSTPSARCRAMAANTALGRPTPTMWIRSPFTITAAGLGPLPVTAADKGRTT